VASRHWFAIVALGRDRPGIVADLSECVYECGYNLEDASMTNLGNEFAVLMLVSGAGSKPDGSLQEAAKRLEWERNLTVFLRPVLDPPIDRPITDSVPYTITAVGVDRAGIVAGVSKCLARRGIGIADLRGAVSEAPQSGTPVYTLTLRLSLGGDDDIAALAEELHEIGERLDVDVSLRPDTD
jgi:glycine cleavage system transcriptional repressor